MTLTAFPRIGAGAFTFPALDVGGPVTNSLFFPDLAINEHPRFPALTRSIRERRGEPVPINVPIFMDAQVLGGRVPLP